MNIRFYTPVYALTLLLSAALLFSVQPMFSKMILPLLGGTPQVWNTAMLFFQVCLLGGYAYAHGTSRFLSIRVQGILHFVLLCVFIGVLPFAIPEGWTPPVDKDPTLWQLSLMAVTVGGPFFVLAGSAPMLQRWFASTDHPDAHNPYFLYGASNLGSMTSLLAYPVIIEPLMTLSGQSTAWMFGYFGLISFTVLSAVLVWQNAASKAQPKAVVAKDAEPVTWEMRIRWLVLAFIPSSLMLGVTTFITTDIASVPLLWILPLAIYVGTFILVFARKPLISEQRIVFLFEIGIILMIAQMIGMQYNKINPGLLIAIHMTVFFLAAMVCHTALAKSKPHASHLTEFYLLMSAGGALGGFFNAIIAPQFFIIPLEYGLVLALAVFVRYSDDKKQYLKATLQSFLEHIQKDGMNTILSGKGFVVIAIVVTSTFAFGIPNKTLFMMSAVILTICLLAIVKNRWLFGSMVALILCIFPLGFDWGQHNFTNLIHRDRNFFGVIRVVDTVDDERILLHGTTNHGAQALADEYKLTPLSYYSPSSPINDVFRFLDKSKRPQEVAVLGLGIGVTACFSAKNRHFDFFEIDPDIADIAADTQYFSYLADCGSPHDVILGDGRLTVQEKPDEHYDLIVLDAFSSDNIPVHLITLDAIEIYLKKLKKNGTLIFNTSNNYIDLEPVLTLTAEKLEIHGLADLTNGGTIPDTELSYYPAHFFVMTRSDRMKKHLEDKGWTAGMRRDGVKIWTDQYSNIVSVLGHEIAMKRFKQKIAEEEKEKKAE